MKDNKKLNQPHYTESVEKIQSNLSDKRENLNNIGFYQNSEVFPPRGSFINIPEDVLFGENRKSLDTIIDNKNHTIGSNLYKETKNEK